MSVPATVASQAQQSDVVAGQLVDGQWGPATADEWIDSHRPRDNSSVGRVAGPVRRRRQCGAGCPRRVPRMA